MAHSLFEGVDRMLKFSFLTVFALVGLTSDTEFGGVRKTAR